MRFHASSRIWVGPGKSRKKTRLLSINTLPAPGQDGAALGRVQSPRARQDAIYCQPPGCSAEREGQNSSRRRFPGHLPAQLPSSLLPWRGDGQLRNQSLRPPPHDGRLHGLPPRLRRLLRCNPWRSPFRRPTSETLSGIKPIIELSQEYPLVQDGFGLSERPAFLTQSKEIEDRQHYDHQTNNIDKAIHNLPCEIGGLPRNGAVIPPSDGTAREHPRRIDLPQRPSVRRICRARLRR